MFRRKEEGLFDATGEHEQLQGELSNEDKAAAQTATAILNAGNAPAQSSPAQPTAQSSSRQNSAAPTANSFRPAANADLTRNRLPDAKPPAAAGVAASFSSPLPLSGDKNKVGKRILTVGNDILLKGEIATCDRLVIEGKVDATLNDVHTVEIAECGSFRGAAQIEDAEISGLFEGELTVRGRLVIYATGKVRGKISYGEIEIERGGELTGEIKMTGAAASANQRPVSRTHAAKDDRVAA